MIIVYFVAFSSPRHSPNKFASALGLSKTFVFVCILSPRNRYAKRRARHFSSVAGSRLSCHGSPQVTKWQTMILLPMSCDRPSAAADRSLCCIARCPYQLPFVSNEQPVDIPKIGYQNGRDQSCAIQHRRQCHAVPVERHSAGRGDRCGAGAFLSLYD